VCYCMASADSQRPSRAGWLLLVQDNDIPLPVIVPPLQGVLPQVRAVMLDEMLIPVDVEGKQVRRYTGDPLNGLGIIPVLGSAGLQASCRTAGGVQGP
jgi:hypothetical protein